MKKSSNSSSKDVDYLLHLGGIGVNGSQVATVCP